MPDKKEKLLPPAFVSPTRLVGHRQNMLRLGFRYSTKHRLLTQPLDLEALAILDGVRRASGKHHRTTLPTHHKGFGSKMEVLFVQSKYFIHLNIRG